MAWRPTKYLVEGELDNTISGKVTGWMKFAGLERNVVFDLEGNFHRDIRGARIHFTSYRSEYDQNAENYMKGFSLHQTGKVGDITAGLTPRDYVDYPYIEWYGDENGRVVLELEPDQIRVMSTPIPACESDPLSRTEQIRNMIGFLKGIAVDIGVPVVTVVHLKTKKRNLE